MFYLVVDDVTTFMGWNIVTLLEENGFYCSTWTLVLIQFLGGFIYCVLVETARKRFSCLTRDLHNLATRIKDKDKIRSFTASGSLEADDVLGQPSRQHLQGHENLSEISLPTTY